LFAASVLQFFIPELIADRLSSADADADADAKPARAALAALGANWVDLWQRLGCDGEPPDLDEALAAVSAAGLITARLVTDGPDETYPVHPGVAEAGRGQAASALICTLIGNDDVAEWVEAAATDLRGFGADDVPSADVAALCRQFGDIPGMNLLGLIEQHCPDSETAEPALRDLIAQVQELAVASPIEANSDPGGLLGGWGTGEDV
jgi:hypothetical protein